MVKKQKQKNIEHFNPFSVIKDILKVIPMIIKMLIFIVKTIPEFFMGLFKTIITFFKELKNVAFGAILSFIVIYQGIQFGFSKMTNLPFSISYKILTIITSYILFSMVVTKNNLLRLAQNIGLKMFVYLFTNPIMKSFVDFDVKINKKNPQMNIKPIMKWVMMNLPRIIIALVITALVIKISIVKIYKYATFYANN